MATLRNTLSSGTAFEATRASCLTPVKNNSGTEQTPAEGNLVPLVLAQVLADLCDWARIPAMKSTETTRRTLHLLERRTFLALASGGLLAAPLAAEGHRRARCIRSAS